MNRTVDARLMIRALGDEPEITITTPSQDLMHDTIDVMGMDVSAYLSGPRAVNFAHDHGRLPVGKTVSLEKSRAGIVARFRWLDANPDVPAVRGVFEEGVLGASVEFVPVEREPIRGAGYHYAKTTLTGWALTGNPANPQCVRLMKSLSLDRRDAVLALEDDGERVLVDPVDLAAALHQGLGAVVRREVARATRAFGHDDVLVPVESGAPASGGPGDRLVAAVDPRELAAMIGNVLAHAVGRELRSQFLALTGRLD